MVQTICMEILGFIMHHLADTLPTEASRMWFQVTNGSPQLACSVGVRMPVLITVVMVLQDGLVGVGALVCSILRITDGLTRMA